MQRAFYGHYSELEDRHWWFVGRRQILRRLLEERGPAHRPVPVLDFGCGTGGWLASLDPYGPVSAVDADPEAVRFTRARGRAAEHVPTGAPLPFPDGTFGLITALDVLEHVEDDVAAVRELLRVGRPGAVVLVTVPAFPLLWGDQDVISQHYRRYTAPGLRRVLEDGGLLVEHQSFFNTALFPVVAAVRLGRRMLRGARGDRTDFDTGPAWADRPLARLLAAEAGPVARRGLPFGVSAVAVARVPG